MKSLTLLLLLRALTCFNNCVALTPLPENREIVRISNGLVRGKYNGNYTSWLGVPYAEPPVGTLRFEPPQPYIRKWMEIFDATQPYKTCIQWDQFKPGTEKLKGNEDCLTVNIYAPQCNGRPKKLPVMIYLHGGAFMFGGDGFTEEYLMESCGIILVKIIYRLGVMGFLSTEDDVIPGNFGLKDQELALHWIKQNIAAFGGDPHRIMLTGFSAGGAATHMHMMRPTLKNFAKVAVSFSGVAINPWVIIRNASVNAIKMAQLMQCPHSTSLEIKDCLQQIEASELVKATRHFLWFGYNPFTVFGPVVEHKSVKNPYINRHPMEIMKSGEFAKIPWLVSFTSEDGGYNCAEVMKKNPETGQELIYELNDRWSELAPVNLFLRNIKDDPVQYAQVLRYKYMGDLPFSPDTYWKYQEMCTDVLFADGIIESMELMSRTCATPVYGYKYSNPADYSMGYFLTGRKDFNFGTNHVDDMSLIAKLESRSALRNDEQIISKKLINMLIGFVNYKKPIYDNCKLPKNCANKWTDLKFTLITSDKCETVIEKVTNI